MDVSRGMYWIGPPGNLYPLKDYVGVLEVTDEDTTRTTPLLGGGRQVAVSRTRPLRSWRVTIPGAHFDEVANLRELLTATMPPYSWVDPMAQVTNVLTPEQSVLKATSPALGFSGAWPISGTGGTEFATVTRTNPSAAFGNIAPVTIGPGPIPPWWAGRKVTVSSYLATSRSAGAYVVLQWLNAAGAPVGSAVTGNAVTGMDGLRRSVATGTPPPGAATFRFTNNYAEVIGRPAATWTDEAVEWDAGNGATQVYVGEVSRSTEYAAPGDRSLRRVDVSFEVKEAGP